MAVPRRLPVDRPAQVQRVDDPLRGQLEVLANQLDQLFVAQPLDELRVFSLASSIKYLEAWPSSRRVFLPNGRIGQPGEIFRQPDLARTLRGMAAVEKKALASGAGFATTVTVTIPNPGSYFLALDVDATHIVAESSETNNFNPILDSPHGNLPITVQ